MCTNVQCYSTRVFFPLSLVLRSFCLYNSSSEMSSSRFVRKRTTQHYSAAGSSRSLSESETNVGEVRTQDTLARGKARYKCNPLNRHSHVMRVCSRRHDHVFFTTHALQVCQLLYPQDLDLCKERNTKVYFIFAEK